MAPSIGWCSLRSHDEADVWFGSIQQRIGTIAVPIAVAAIGALQGLDTGLGTTLDKISPALNQPRTTRARHFVTAGPRIAA